MRRFKLIAILALAIFPALVWVVALSDTSVSLVNTIGLSTCVAYAAGIAIITAWLIVIFLEELREY